MNIIYYIYYIYGFNIYNLFYSATWYKIEKLFLSYLRQELKGLKLKSCLTCKPFYFGANGKLHLCVCLKTYMYLHHCKPIIEIKSK